MSDVVRKNGSGSKLRSQVLYNITCNGPEIKRPLVRHRVINAHPSVNDVAHFAKRPGIAAALLKGEMVADVDGTYNGRVGQLRLWWHGQ